MLSRNEEMIARKQILEAAEEEENCKAKIESLEIQVADVIVRIDDGAESVEAYNLFEKIDRIESINYIAMKAKSFIFRVMAIRKMTNSLLLNSIVFDRKATFCERLAAIKNDNCTASQQELFEMAKESIENAKLALERLESGELLKEFAKDINDISWKNNWGNNTSNEKRDILIAILEKINDDITLEELALIGSEFDFKVYCQMINSQTVLYDIALKTFGNVSNYFSNVIHYLDVEHIEKLFMEVCKQASKSCKMDFVYLLLKIQSLKMIKYFFLSDLRDIIKKDDKVAIKRYRKDNDIRDIVIKKLAELN